MMELRHLRYFEAVAAERNVTRAAERLGIAQPPLSRQLRELEAEMGVELFDRTSRPIRLTEAGRVFQEQSRQILALAEQLRRTMRHFATARRRYVLGFVGSVVYGTMPDVVRRFRSALSGSDVQLVELTTLEQVAALRDGRIDAGIGRVRIDDPAVRREVLYEERLVVALPAGHRLAGRGKLSLLELAAEKLIVYPSQPRPSYADQILALVRAHAVPLGAVEEVREVHTALGLVAAEAGIAIVPSSMRRMQRGDLRYVPIADRDATSPVILSTRARDISAETALLRRIAAEPSADAPDRGGAEPG